MGYKSSFKLTFLPQVTSNHKRRLPRDVLDDSPKDHVDNLLQEITEIENKICRRPLRQFTHGGEINHKYHRKIYGLERARAFVNSNVNRLFDMLSENNNDVKKEALNVLIKFISYMPKQNEYFVKNIYPNIQLNSLHRLSNLLFNNDKGSKTHFLQDIFLDDIKIMSNNTYIVIDLEDILRNLANSDKVRKSHREKINNILSNFGEIIKNSYKTH